MICIGTEGIELQKLVCSALALFEQVAARPLGSKSDKIKIMACKKHLIPSKLARYFFFLCFCTGGSEANSWFPGLGPLWAVVSRD